MPKTDYLATAQLNDVFRTTKFTAPTTVYVSLHTADPGRGGSLANELTIGVGGYARAAVVVADAQWSAPADSADMVEILNAGVISFGTASAGLGTVTHVGINTASTAGNMLWSGALGTPRAIANGDPIQVPIGSLRIAE